MLHSPSSDFPLWRTILGRVRRRRQMDFDFALFQMVLLITSPRKVNQLGMFRKDAKQRLARDDPAFPVLLCWFLNALLHAAHFSCGRSLFSSLATSVIYTSLWIIFGWIIAALAWTLVPRSGPSQGASMYETNSSAVEYIFCFDVHCNASFLVIVFLSSCFFLLPFLVKEGYLATLVSNTVSFIALAIYVLMSAINYSSLPDVSTDFILRSISTIFIIFSCFSIFNFNLIAWFLSLTCPGG